MMPWLAQWVFSVWLAVSLWAFHRRSERKRAELWKALAELRKQHSELEGATSAAAFGVVDDRFDELDTVVTVAPPPAVQLQELPGPAKVGG